MSTRSRIGGTSFSSSCAAKYYGPDATSTKSARILVAEREVVWLHALNLGPEDCIEILQVVGDQCVPYMPVPGICLEMDDCATSMALGVPGTYVMQINEEALGRVSVTASIDCDGENYLDWLKTFQEKHMSKKPFPYENECAPGVTDAKGALDFLLDQSKGIEDTDDQTASEVPIEDADGNFAGNNVEAALAELGADCVTKTAAIEDLNDRVAQLEGGTVSSIVQNADGDYVITYFDGTQAILDDIDVPEISAATDGDGLVTFTLNGVTFGPFEPGPHVEDTDTKYAFTLNPDGSFTATGSDGMVFTSAPGTVDTDTFATFAGNVITFADGNTLDTSTLNATSSLRRNADGTITHVGDNGVDGLTIPLDTTTQTAAANPLIYGLSVGQVNKPVNAAATTADVTGADPALEVSYISMREMFTNEAAEQSGFGRMNEDGTLGFFSHRFGQSTDINAIIEGYNGAYFTKNTTSPNAALAWDGVTVPPSRYAGQRLYLKSTNASSRYDNATITIPLNGGYYRATNGVWTYAGVNATYDIWVRSGELLELVGTGGGAWEITYHNINQFFGAGWHENRDGTASMHFQAGIPAGQQGIISSVPLPITVTNPTDLNVNITDKFYFPGGAIGGGAPLLAEVFVNLPTQNTVSSIAFTNYLAGDNINESTFTGAIDVQVERGIIDYSAL